MVMHERRVRLEIVGCTNSAQEPATRALSRQRQTRVRT